MPNLALVLAKSRLERRAGVAAEGAAGDGGAAAESSSAEGATGGESGDESTGESASTGASGAAANGVDSSDSSAIDHLAGNGIASKGGVSGFRPYSGVYSYFSDNSYLSYTYIQSSAPSNSSASPMYLLGDTRSVASLLISLTSYPSSCDVANSTINKYISGNATQPGPEQALQYYRRGEIVLGLTGFNNSFNAVNASTPLPSGTNTTLLSCVNGTIADILPITSSAKGLGVESHVGLIGFGWLLLWAMGVF